MRFAARISIRVMHELVRRLESLFPQKNVPVYEEGSDEDSHRQRYGADQKLLR